MAGVRSYLLGGLPVSSVSSSLSLPPSVSVSTFLSSARSRVTNHFIELSFTITQREGVDPYDIARGRICSRCSILTTAKAKLNDNSSISKTPQFLKLAVGGLTEFLRLFSPTTTTTNNNHRVNFGIEEGKDKIPVSVSGVDDVLVIIKSDYDHAYFVTGIFTSAIYANDCVFEDPTMKFQGTDLYSRNLQLVVPFFDQPLIALKEINKEATSEGYFVLAKWRLRTYLKLPWRPLIAIDGNTVYDLNEEFKIVRHAESWSVSALEAVGQIFTPNVKGM